MRLSATNRAVEWLAQFEVDDRLGAIALLDALRFVPGGDVVTGVRRLVERFIKENSDGLPVAIVPVISDEDISRVGDVRADSPATAFVDFDPAQPIANDPGSEALMAQLIVELRRATAPGVILPAPLTIDAMSGARTRTLVCVTDYIGSGRQVLEYVDAWYRNTTIKSWCSFGWLKIVVIAYAATVDGLRAVKASKHLHGVEIVEIVPGKEQLRRADPDGKAEEVCQVYARRGRVGPALGHQGSAGLYASSFSVPNNLPGILIRRSPQWVPFFDGRSVSTELADEIGDYRPDGDVPRQLAEAGQNRLAARHRDGHIDMRWKDYIAILGLLPRTDEELALGLGLDMQSVSRMMTSIEGLGLVDDRRTVTSAGRRTLELHRRKPRAAQPVLTRDPSPYYPRYTT